MRKGYKRLIGYREDLCLARFWWHRLCRVLCIATTIWIFFWAFGAFSDVYTVREALPPSPDGFFTGYRTIEVHPVWSLASAALFAFVLNVIINNLYYRVILYVTHGSRPRTASADS